MAASDKETSHMYFSLSNYIGDWCANYPTEAIRKT